jgi:hypothetical protein
MLQGNRMWNDFEFFAGMARSCDRQWFGQSRFPERGREECCSSHPPTRAGGYPAVNNQGNCQKWTSLLYSAHLHQQSDDFLHETASTSHFDDQRQTTLVLRRNATNHLRKIVNKAYGVDLSTLFRELVPARPAIVV